MKRTDIQKAVAWMKRNGYNFDITEKYGCSYGNTGVHVKAYKVTFESDRYSALYGDGTTNGFSTESRFLEYMNRLQGVVIRDNSSLYWHTIILVDSGDFTAVLTFDNWRKGQIEHFENWYHALRERYGKENVIAG